MRTQDIVIGQTYRLRTSPNYGYVKALAIIKPKPKCRMWPGDIETTHVVVRCEHTVEKNDTFGFIRYFRPSDILRDSSK